MEKIGTKTFRIRKVVLGLERVIHSPIALLRKTGIVLFTLPFIGLLGILLFTEISRIESERRKYLYRPKDWMMISVLADGKDSADNLLRDTGLSIGGGSASILPLDIKRYQVKKGDTLSEIADRFGMDLDTIASLNREWGSGVHLISVGEEIKIPNQDGIYITIPNNLEEICSEKNVPVEVVLQVNQISRGDLSPGAALFFPGVQHTGVERSVMTGTAFLRPVRGWVSSNFGYRRDPFSKEMKFHRGIDIANRTGAAIRASLDGVVVAIGFDPIFGNFIFVRHQVGYTTLYGHLQKALVTRGNWVTRGQKIGLMGNSGKSTGPHLHFEIRKNGVPIQPIGLISGIF